MPTLIASVIIASLLGSLHCAGMCGAFVAFAVGGVGDRDHTGEDRPSRAVLQAAYHGGRLITYTLLGVVAGAAGQAIDLGGSVVGVREFAAMLAAATMIGAGSIALARAAGVRTPRVAFPQAWQRAFVKGHELTIGLNPTGRALAIGLLTTLLPCGWLWAFAVVAAGTANPFYGGITMAAFWIGTLPALITVGVGVRALTGRFGRYVPGAMAALIVVVGVMTLATRVGVTLPDPGRVVRPASLGPADIDVPTPTGPHLPFFHTEACGDVDARGS